jgi:BirA family transcriptional regulator, biotin operon repressor / biotin---[acetyl-CoA-carboxylase] ligase
LKTYSLKSTLFLGKTLHLFEEIASTNAFALEQIARANIAEGTVYATFNQTSGRGQMSTRWESEPNANIALSVVFRPRFLSAAQQFYLSKSIALAVFDFIQESLIKKSFDAAENHKPVCIKWPNDIYVGNLKIAGILIQNALLGAEIGHSVVGIGVNINQENFVFAPQATSLKNEGNFHYDLSFMIERLCLKLEQRYLELKTSSFAKISMDYQNKLLGFGELRKFERTADGTPFSGKILGVTDEGYLKIENQTDVEEFDLKEVKFKF